MHSHPPRELDPRLILILTLLILTCLNVAVILWASPATKHTDTPTVEPPSGVSGYVTHSYQLLAEHTAPLRERVSRCWRVWGEAAWQFVRRSYSTLTGGRLAGPERLFSTPQCPQGDKQSSSKFTLETLCWMVLRSVLLSSLSLLCALDLGERVSLHLTQRPSSLPSHSPVGLEHPGMYAWIPDESTGPLVEVVWLKEPPHLALREEGLDWIIADLVARGSLLAACAFAAIY